MERNLIFSVNIAMHLRYKYFMRLFEILDPKSLPIRQVKKAYHIGALDAAKKQRNSSGTSLSYEGDGVSISNRPDAWVRIAQLGGNPLWLCQKPDGRFLDSKRLTAVQRQAIIAWGNSIEIRMSGWLRLLMPIEY